MAARKKSDKEIKDNQKKQKFRIKVKKAARRSGKISKTEGKVENARSKKQLNVSQKRAVLPKSFMNKSGNKSKYYIQKFLNL